MTSSEKRLFEALVSHDKSLPASYARLGAIRSFLIYNRLPFVDRKSVQFCFKMSNLRTNYTKAWNGNWRNFRWSICPPHSYRRILTSCSTWCGNSLKRALSGAHSTRTHAFAFQQVFMEKRWFSPVSSFNGNVCLHADHGYGLRVIATHQPCVN